MITADLNIHHVTRITIDAATIKGFASGDFGRVRITLVRSDGNEVEITAFVEDREDFKLNIAGIERGLYFV